MPMNLFPIYIQKLCRWQMNLALVGCQARMKLQIGKGRNGSSTWRAYPNLLKLHRYCCISVAFVFLAPPNVLFSSGFLVA